MIVTRGLGRRGPASLLASGGLGVVGAAAPPAPPPEPELRPTEARIRRCLLAYPPLVDLIGQRVALNVFTERVATPYVVFTTKHSPLFQLSGESAGDDIAVSIVCWARGAAVADRVADAVTAALASDPAVDAAVLSRATGMLRELGLDATMLTVALWE